MTLTDVYGEYILVVKGGDRLMTKKLASFRLSDETLDDLHYLTEISHKSQAAIIEDLVNIYYHAVLAEAFGFKKRDDLDPTFLIRGGTIITVEEQKALKTVRDRLAGGRS